ncbi:hypothetical protein EOM39_00580 [Candidatus Gracilibacteria bacterium]|nr:hypothetical protein [Candidatus Gracilibacteria bacterium]
MRKYFNNSKAFTLVEIMFVVAIITFLSVSGISYFNSFIDEKKVATDNFLIENKLNELDLKVNNREAYDYEASFSGAKDYFLYKYDQSIKAANSTLTIDKTTKSFVLSLNLTATGSWEIKVFNNNKFLYGKLMDQSKTYTGYLNKYQSYDFKTTYNLGQNNVGIFYFSKDNLSASGLTTNFIEANTELDKSGLKTSEFTLKNINSKKSFYSGNTLWDNKEVYLFFEKGGYEKSIKITSN